MYWLKESWLIIYQYLSRQTEDASHQITLFGIVMMINYPLFGVFWKLESFQLSEEFCLRLIATFLCACLATNRFWPRLLLKWLPVFWYLVLLFCLPYFFCYLTLINHCSTLWLMNCVSAIFFLLLVTSVLGSVILIFLGCGLAFFSYFLSHPVMEYMPGNISLFSLLITGIAAIVIGTLFARDREIIHAGRLSGIRMMASSIAHDLRTPLASIYLQAELQQIILNKIKNTEIRKDLQESLNKITRGIETSNRIISMQLSNIRHNKFNTSNFSIYPIQNLIERAVNDYPLKETQKSLIQVSYEDSFSIWLEELAFKNLLWNVLKNSIEYIEETGKGIISIWLETGVESDNFNYLHVKDTARGIYSKNFEKIFEPFYSDRQNGTGLGLAYCKLLMKEVGGDIFCKGKLNEFAHFTIKFPKID